MRIRDFIPPAVLALTVFSFAGCGDDQAHTRSLSQYTPEILVEETLTRYKAAIKTARSGGKGKVDVKSAKSAGKGKAAGAGADDDKISAAEAKYGGEVRSRDTAETTQAAPVVSISEGVVRKVPLIQGLPANVVYMKLDEVIDHDPELTADEKGALKDGIAEARKKGPTTRE